LVEAIRLSIIDDTNRGDHSHLRPDDVCYHLFEYTSHRDFKFSSTNDLIQNLKKKPSRAGQSGYWYKGKAIGDCSAHLRSMLNPEWLSIATLVPVPGSKALGHADFDDRIEQICRGISNPAPDVRNLVRQTASTTASHEAGDGDRITVAELIALYEIDEALAQPTPAAIGIVDDVLTAGTHYRAMHTVLSQRFPDIPIIGLFIARRIFPPLPAFDDFDELPSP
jgi:hypothetical protein